MRRGTHDVHNTFELVNGEETIDLNSSAMIYRQSILPYNNLVGDWTTGGFVQLDHPEERIVETVFAGVKVITERDSNGGIVDFASTVQGTICCFYTHTNASDDEASSSVDFQEFFARHA